MQFDRNAIVLGITLSTTVALLAGCDSAKSPPPPPPAAQATVGNEIDDTVVTTRVKSALLSEEAVRSFDLQIETRKGVVQVNGFVDNQAQIDRALQVVRGVAGVQRVDSNLRIKDGNATVGNVVDDGIVTSRVKTALLNDPKVRSFDISVVTRKGEVQLSGFIDSQAQIDEIVAIANRVEGVGRVDNAMSIKK